MFLPPDFSTDTSIELANLVDEAYSMYQADKNKTPWNYPTGYTGILQFNARAIEEDKRLGFVAQKENGLYIIFRGTDNIAEWVRDVEANQATFIPGWGKIHVGFRDILNSCKIGILESVHTHLQASITDVYVAGHSLGGAIASLCLPYLKSNLETATNVNFHLYTFSSPRVGDRDFANSYINNPKITTWRIFNTEDIFPTLPLAVNILPFTGQYEHVGLPVVYSVQDGSLVGNHSLDRFREQLNQAATSILTKDEIKQQPAISRGGSFAPSPDKPG